MIYLDGAMKDTGTNSQNIDPTEDLIIGGSDDPLWEECKGDIGSVMMYDKWLTPKTKSSKTVMLKKGAIRRVMIFVKTFSAYIGVS